MSEGTKRTKWALSKEALDGLLAALHADRTQAGVRYEQLRLKLVKFFTWERTTFPEERADEALNRLAKRMVEGESIGSVEAYLHGVAHRRPAGIPGGGPAGAKTGGGPQPHGPLSGPQSGRGTGGPLPHRLP
jgi:hypothetical protein